MPTIPQGRSLRFYRLCLLYVWARLKANPDTTSLAPPVRELIDKMDAHLAKQQIAEDTLVLAYAQRDHDDDGLDALVHRLGRWALDRADGDRDAPSYKNLLTDPPHKIANSPIDKELQAVAVVVAKLKADPNDTDALELADKLDEAMEALKLSQAALPETHNAQAVLSGTRGLLRDEANRLLDRTEGMLMVQWAGQRKRIRRFFDYISQRLRRRSRSSDDDDGAEESDG